MVIDRMARDVPTCQLDDSLAEAKRRAEKLGFNLCPVVNKHDWGSALVTSSDGKLMGIFRRELSAEKKQIPKSEIWA